MVQSGGHQGKKHAVENIEIGGSLTDLSCVHTGHIETDDVTQIAPRAEITISIDVGKNAAATCSCSCHSLSSGTCHCSCRCSCRSSRHSACHSSCLCTCHNPANYEQTFAFRQKSPSFKEPPMLCKKSKASPYRNGQVWGNRVPTKKRARLLHEQPPDSCQDASTLLSNDGVCSPDVASC